MMMMMMEGEERKEEEKKEKTFGFFLAVSFLSLKKYVYVPIHNTTKEI